MKKKMKKKKKKEKRRIRRGGRRMSFSKMYIDSSFIAVASPDSILIPESVHPP